MEIEDHGLKKQGGFKKWTKGEQNSKTEKCVCRGENSGTFRGVQVKPVW